MSNPQAPVVAALIGPFRDICATAMLEALRLSEELAPHTGRHAVWMTWLSAVAESGSLVAAGAPSDDRKELFALAEQALEFGHARLEMLRGLSAAQARLETALAKHRRDRNHRKGRK